MSATIFWRPVKPEEDKHISTSAPSHFLAAMREVGMELPCTIGKSSIPTLRGMAATHQNSSTSNPYQEILDLLTTYDSIELGAEH